MTICAVNREEAVSKGYCRADNWLKNRDSFYQSSRNYVSTLTSDYTYMGIATSSVRGELLAMTKCYKR